MLASSIRVVRKSPCFATPVMYPKNVTILACILFLFFVRLPIFQHLNVMREIATQACYVIRSSYVLFYNRHSVTVSWEILTNQNVVHKKKSSADRQLKIHTFQ